MELVPHKLCALPYSNENWSHTAITEVRRTAFQFEKERGPQGIPEVTGLLHDATLTYTSLPPEADQSAVVLPGYGTHGQ